MEEATTRGLRQSGCGWFHKENRRRRVVAGRRWQLLARCVRTNDPPDFATFFARLAGSDVWLAKLHVGRRWGRKNAVPRFKGSSLPTSWGSRLRRGARARNRLKIMLAVRQRTSPSEPKAYAPGRRRGSASGALAVVPHGARAHRSRSSYRRTGRSAVNPAPRWNAASEQAAGDLLAPRRTRGRPAAYDPILTRVSSSPGRR